MQRLRLLRGGLPVRRHRAPDEGHERRRTARPEETSASPRSARSATTGSAPARRPRAPRPARPPRSSSATSTSCATAPGRVAELHELGYTEARLYGVDDDDGVGGTGSIFLLLDEPEVYGLPPDPRVTTADLPDMFRKAGSRRLAMLAMAAASFVGRRKYDQPLRRRPAAGAARAGAARREAGRRRAATAARAVTSR